MCFCDEESAMFINAEADRVLKHRFGCKKFRLQARSDLELFHPQFSLAGWSVGGMLRQKRLGKHHAGHREDQASSNFQKLIWTIHYRDYKDCPIQFKDSEAFLYA